MAKAIAVVAALAAALGGSPATPAQGSDALRARLSYAALQRHYHRSDTGLYRDRAPGGRTAPATAWPYSQVLAAALAVARLPGSGAGERVEAQGRVAGLQDYWDAGARPPAFASHLKPPLGPGGHHWYDDNAWLGLDLVEAYRLTGDPASLRRAQQVFDRIVAGWDDDGSKPCAGGVSWTDDPANGDRNAVSNAPGAELGLELYGLTRRWPDFTWGRRLYHWVVRCLRSPEGLYFDHVRADGGVDRTIWSYNQGTMAGASLLMWQTGRHRAHLVRARRIARAAVRYFTPARLRTEPPEFVAIMAANVLPLDDIGSAGRYRRALRAYADWVWRRRRDARTGLFRLADSGHFGLIQQAAMVRIYAALARPPTLPP